MAKSVLVIGGAGVFGSEVCKTLSEKGFQPIVIDDLSTGVSERIKFGPMVKVNAKETPRIVRSLQEYSSVDVIHCALTGETSQALETTLSLLKALQTVKGRSLTIVERNPNPQTALLARILSDVSSATGLKTVFLSGSSSSEALTEILQTLS